MHSIEKYIANLLCDFFGNYKGDLFLKEELSSEIKKHITQFSTIEFGDLKVDCSLENNRFVGFILCNSLQKKMEFNFFKK